MNKAKYGLSDKEVETLKLPDPRHLVSVYNINKITNPRAKLSILEKINHFIKLQDALNSKLSKMIAMKQ